MFHFIIIIYLFILKISLLSVSFPYIRVSRGGRRHFTGNSRSSKPPPPQINDEFFMFIFDRRRRGGEWKTKESEMAVYKATASSGLTLVARVAINFY